MHYPNSPIFFLIAPDITHLFTSSFPEHEGRSLRRLRKEYLRVVLHDLQEVAHHVYVLLENLPENRFAIVRYYDHARNRMQLPAFGEDDPFTLRQFARHYDLLHEQDIFRVYFFKEVFYYEQRLTPHLLEIVYRHYLKYMCEQGLRANKPVELTATQIVAYSLTQADAGLVGALLGRFNRAAAQAFRDEYNVLSTLDCIKNGIP